MDVAFLIEVETLSGALDQLDYFAVLKLTPAATPAEIRAAYHRASREFHPDRYAAVESAELRGSVARIYRRINEAWSVLRDDARRRKYAADVSGPDRDRKLRFSEDDHAAVRDARNRKAVEQTGQTPGGRKLYAAALLDVQAGRWEAAERNVRMALSFEPTNELFRELLTRAEKNRPRQDFRIK